MSKRNPVSRIPGPENHRRSVASEPPARKHARHRGGTKLRAVLKNHAMSIHDTYVRW